KTPPNSDHGKDETLHYCPMDPEVEQMGPGSCPKCGMALQPLPPSLATSKVEYTCPMHPEIVRDAPGQCPICGMALEPREVSLEELEHPELTTMRRRFWVGVVFSVPLLFLAMGEMSPALAHLRERIPAPWWNFLQLLLASPVVLWGGWPFFQRAWRSLV